MYTYDIPSSDEYSKPHPGWLVTSFHLPTPSWTENNPGKGPKRPKRPKIWNHLEKDTKDLSKYWVDTTGNGTWVSWRKTDQPQNVLKVRLCFFIQNETIWLFLQVATFSRKPVFFISWRFMVLFAFFLGMSVWQSVFGIFGVETHDVILHQLLNPDIRALYLLMACMKSDG